MSIGVPVIYGAPGTYYRDALTEDAETDPDDRDEDAIPLDNVVTVLLGFSLSFSF
jgi:CO dehydrogenase/acetyl-CoA synthase alpha subunit